MYSSGFRKTATLVLVAGISLGGAAACSSSKPATGDSATPGAAGGVADGKPLDPNATVTLSIDCAPASDQPGQHGSYADDMATFKSMYPNVTILAVPKTKCEDPAPFTAMLKGKSETNVFYSYFTDKQQVLDSGQAADISKYVNSDTVPAFKDILPSVLAMTTDNGKLYGLPKTYYTMGLVYNRTLFTQAGLNPDKPPTTWAELATDAAAISALGNGISGFEDYSGGNTGGWHFADELYSLGGKMVTADGKKAAFNSAEGTQVLQSLFDMRWKTHGIGPTPVTQWADAFPPLAAGKVGMFIGAADAEQRLIEVLKVKNGDWGLGAQPGGKGAQQGGDDFYFKATDSPNQIKAGVAWLNFEFLTPGQGQFNYVRNAAASTDDKPLAVGLPQPEFFVGGSATEKADTASKIANGKNTTPANYTSFVNSPVVGVAEPPAAQQLYKIMDTAMSAVMTDQSANIPALLKAAEDQANQVLANQ